MDNKDYKKELFDTLNLTLEKVKSIRALADETFKQFIAENNIDVDDENKEQKKPVEILKKTGLFKKDDLT